MGLWIRIGNWAWRSGLGKGWWKISRKQKNSKSFSRQVFLYVKINSKNISFYKLFLKMPSSFVNLHFLNTKEFAKKYAGNILISVFLHFWSYFVPMKRFSCPKSNLSDQCGSFDTHIAILYDALCHMASVIKCHFMTDAIWHKVT